MTSSSSPPHTRYLPSLDTDTDEMAPLCDLVAKCTSKPAREKSPDEEPEFRAED